MRVFKPMQASLFHKTFQLKGKHRLAVTLMFGFPFEGKDALPESDLWQFISKELGKDGILDMGMPKPNGEVLVYGKCFSPLTSATLGNSDFYEVEFMNAMVGGPICRARTCIGPNSNTGGGADDPR